MQPIKEAFRGARVLVTGHTGFKGSWLSLWLARLGARVTGASIGIPTTPSHFEAARLAGRITDERVDVRDADAVAALVARVRPDFLFHLAAQPLVRRSYSDPFETWQTNTLGTVNVLDALRRTDAPCTAVFITSDKCYDNVEWVWGYRETDALGGPDPYSASKGAAELAIRSYVRSYFPRDGRVRIGVGRAGNVIGGGDWAADRIVPDCVRAWSSRGLVELRNPSATRPWQHVLEPLGGYLALAGALAAGNGLHGEPFNFGPPGEQDHPVGKLVDDLAATWPGARWDDVSAKYGGPHESGLLKLNCDKALHHLGWHAAWPFTTTVSETAAWYRRYYGAPGEDIAAFSESQIDAYTQHARERGLAWAR